MKANIAVLPGDGVGPEVTAAARTVLEVVATRFGHELVFAEHLMGDAAIDVAGKSLPDETLAACKAADAVLFGAVGGREGAPTKPGVRPEQGLLTLRRELGLFANLRPVVPHPALFDASPLENKRLAGADLLFFRELTGGIYFGEKYRDDHRATDTCTYTVPEIERVVRAAAKAAVGRRGKLTSVDKANVLETSRLWRATTDRVIADEFPDLELEHVLVDAMAMHLLQRPADFDVVVTENLFGDVLTDEASALAGSMGMLPSASLGAERGGLYEPIHGSAPDIAGQGIANPCGAILSAALLLRHSLGLEDEAKCIEDAVGATLAAGHRTRDIAAGGEVLNTVGMAEKVAEALGAAAPTA